jgi:hypothetical protein
VPEETIENLIELQQLPDSTKAAVNDHGPLGKHPLFAPPAEFTRSGTSNN